MKEKKQVVFFNKGLFEKSFMNSRITSPTMTWKEKILGFLLGPFGTLALIAVVNQLMELYYTEVFYIDQIFGVGTYLVMSWITRLVSIITGFAAAYVIEHTVSSQGKVRPLILMGALVVTVSGFFMFYIPEMPQWMMLAWVYLFNILYNGVGMTLFNLRVNMMTLSTRDQKDRTQINLIDKISSFLLIGTAVTLTVGSVLYYTMLHNHAAENWILLVGGFAALSLVFSFIQYFYTRERITEEVAEEGDQGSQYSHWYKFKALFHCKYWVLAFLLMAVSTIVANLSGYNLATNFCTIILGADAQNNYNLIYTVASGLPMGLGILIMYPLCQKYTIRKTTMAFSLIAILGCVVGLIVKDAFWPVVVANFIFNMGTLPFVYIIGALVNSANDEVEYKYGFRPEGTMAVAIATCLSTLVTGLFAGVYETGLSMGGYVPELGTAQPQAVVNWLYIVRYAIPIVEYAIFILILHFLDLERKLPEMQEAIRVRREKRKVEGE